MERDVGLGATSSPSEKLLEQKKFVRFFKMVEDTLGESVMLAMKTKRDMSRETKTRFGDFFV